MSHSTSRSFRWFAWGCFLPVFRLHGERSPWYERDVKLGPDGIQILSSGQPNEVWSYGDTVYDIMCRYLFLREKLKPYIKRITDEAAETGAPIIRPLFFDFPDDAEAWNVCKAHMFGPDILVSPVTEPGTETWEVYLPAGTDWIESATGHIYTGGQTVSAYAPLDTIPIFIRDGADVEVYG